VYPCREPGTWLAIAARNDEEWERLEERMGGKPDPRFATSSGRLGAQDALDALVAGWTRTQDAHEAMIALQALGIPAAKVMSAADLFRDPQLRARGFFVELEHPNAGRHDYAGFPIHFSATPPVFRGDAPRLGEHNRAVLQQLAGMTDAQIEALAAEGAIDWRPPG
jgi:crotonobetainyl-CoA:carnitine CoA-transferase CaiB-like acyl-CoA transferase